MLAPLQAPAESGVVGPGEREGEVAELAVGLAVPAAGEEGRTREAKSLEVAKEDEAVEEGGGGLEEGGEEEALAGGEELVLVARVGGADALFELGLEAEATDGMAREDEAQATRRAPSIAPREESSADSGETYSCSSSEDRPATPKVLESEISLRVSWYIFKAKGVAPSSTRPARPIAIQGMGSVSTGTSLP